MDVKRTLFLLIPLLGLCSCPPLCIETEEYVLIENVNVVDVINGKLLPKQTVVLQDSTIHYLGRNWPEKEQHRYRVIDGSDRYLIPGLWDMHFHLTWEASNESLLFPLLLAHGITGVRDMGGDLRIQQEMKAKVAANPALGPEIYGAGPILDGDPPVMYDFSIPLGEPAAVDEVLDSLVNAGSAFFKTYSLITKPVLEQVAKYARQHDLTFAGHLSEYVDPEYSISVGQKSIEHLNRLEEIWQNDTTRMGQLAQLMQQGGTWLCPTLVIYQLKARSSDLWVEHPAYAPFIHPLLQQEWEGSKARRSAQDEEKDWHDQAHLYEKQLQLVSYLKEAGVGILAGSDFAGMPYVYPGIGLHEEMKLLSKAGLSNAEVLAAATINPARYLERENRYGSVEVGKYADLVLLSENPLLDINAIDHIEKVFRKGNEVGGLEDFSAALLPAKDTLPVTQTVDPVPGRHIRE